MARRPSDPAKAELVERVVAAASAVLVLGVIVFLVRDGLTNEEPPRLEIVASDYDAAAGRLDFVLRNAGGQAASAVVVSALTRGPDGTTERRSLTIEHAPPGSEATGAFLVPLPTELVVDGYVDP